MTHAEIIAEARDKYTVHNCNQCEYRKSCDLNSYGFDSDECRKMRQSIMLGFGIEDGYFTKLLDSLEAAHERERGNSAVLREALTKVKEWMAHRIATCGFEASATVPTMLEDVVLPALAAPARECDVGTPAEQTARFAEFCKSHRHSDMPKCAGCPLEDIPDGTGCSQALGQMPYNESEVSNDK